MSLELINRSNDLSRLHLDGFDLEVREGHLLLKNIPYVNEGKLVKMGTLVSVLTLRGDETARPGTHVVFFDGEVPCHADGSPITGIIHAEKEQLLAGVHVKRSFSSKPKGGYEDYYQKMSTYALILSTPATELDSSVSPCPFLPLECNSDESVFKYHDSWSSRAGIQSISDKLRIDKVAIIGLGGTGSYILDLVAKTPVGEIHLFDGDSFLQHNAFRSPGAPTVEALRGRPSKVEYFRQIYSGMHRGIFAHEKYVDENDFQLLGEMSFVFLSMDSTPIKGQLLAALLAQNVPFIDVGLGVIRHQDSLLGQLRTTTSSTAKSDHIMNSGLIPIDSDDGENIYDFNVQIADLNALNAALAVSKWKKLYGFYVDLENEHHSLFVIDGNKVINEQRS